MASCVEGKEKRSGQRAMNRSKQAAMVSKLAVLLLISWTLVFVRLAEAQQPKKVPRIGLLSVASASALTGQLDAFRQGLRELGYSEGKNIVVEYRYGDGKADRVPELAAELVSLKVDLIVTYQTPSVLALRKAFGNNTYCLC